MAMRCKHFPQRSADLAATPAVGASVTMVVTVTSVVMVSVVFGIWVDVVGHARRPFGRAGFDSALMVSGCRVASSAASR